MVDWAQSTDLLTNFAEKTLFLSFFRVFCSLLNLNGIWNEGKGHSYFVYSFNGMRPPVLMYWFQGFKDTRKLFASDIKMCLEICLGDVTFTRKQCITNIAK